jgi:hypothetical protein
LVSYAPGARGDFGLYVMNGNGSRITALHDRPGTLELDAAPIVRWKGWRAAHRADREPVADLPGGVPAFRFHDLDVFAGHRAGHGAAPRTQGVRLRFFAIVPGAGERGDTAILVHEAPVSPNGEVDVRLPAGVPMFEQLVDSTGRVLMTAHGPAHVAGSNAGVAGTTTRCVGCHLGHSTIPAPARGQVARSARP